MRKNLFKDKYPKKEKVPKRRKNKLLKKTISKDGKFSRPSKNPIFFPSSLYVHNKIFQSQISAIQICELIVNSGSIPNLFSIKLIF